MADLMAQLAASKGAVPTEPEEPPLLAHWRVLHPKAANASIKKCVRCGDGDAPTCNFHPDAKAFAFGTGRFQYGYDTNWDTPHDRWFCCGGAAAECSGCCEEPHHTTRETWWEAYVHLAPALESHECEDSSSDEGQDGCAPMEVE
jgi:hypothetical protein